MDISILSLFIVSSIILITVPGPSVFYVVARSIDQGRNVGFVSVLGVATGSMIHILAAALGISALLMTSAFAFNLVKYMGAAYLIYLGVKTLFFTKDKVADSSPMKTVHKRLIKVFYESIIVEALNPKTALFFLALFPQFINPSASAVPMQFFILGSIFIAIGILSDGIYVLLASSIRNWLVGSSFRIKIQEWLTGGTYIVLGITAAFANVSQK